MKTKTFDTDLTRRVEALITAFRSETGVDLPPGYLADGEKPDMPGGDLSLWVLRSAGVLERLGLWAEHPGGSLALERAAAAAEGRDPAPSVRFRDGPHPSGDRLFWGSDAARAAWAAAEARDAIGSAVAPSVAPVPTPPRGPRGKRQTGGDA